MHTIKQLVKDIQSGNTPEDVLTLLKNKEKEAPYASLVYILRAMNENDPELRFQAAIYSPDRGRLKHLVNANPQPVATIEPFVSEPVPVVIPKKEPVLDFSQVLETEEAIEAHVSQKKIRPVAMWKITPLSIISDKPSAQKTGAGWKLSIPSNGSEQNISTPLNDYVKEQTALGMQKSTEISSSVQVEAKRQEVDLVNQFLAKPAQMLRKTAVSSSVAEIVEAKATESLHADDSLVTETLAKLHLRQNHPGEAIQIYEQLCLRYPEKSRYFESQIQKIKENEL